MSAHNIKSPPTPLPWKAVSPCPGECCWHVVPETFDETALRRDNWHEMVNLPEMSEADAKLIVRAVNAHDDLLEAAEAAMQCIGELPPTQTRVEVAQMLTAAIAKAGGAS